MRKINSKENIEKKRQRNQIILGIILIGTMLVSTAGYAFFNYDGNEVIREKVKINGVDFQLKDDGLWHFQIEDNEFYTSFNPKEIENISSTFYFNINNIYNKPLYYVGGNNYAHNEINQNLGRYILRYQEVCLSNNNESMGNCEENLPLKSCSDNILVFVESNTTRIYNDNNCLFIESSYSDQIKASDKIIFKILGIEG